MAHVQCKTSCTQAAALFLSIDDDEQREKEAAEAD